MLPRLVNPARHGGVFLQGRKEDALKRLALVPAALIGLALLAGVASAATVVRVSGNTAAAENQPGWMFNRDPLTASPYEFNNDEASIGTGSLYVLPIGANPADKFIAELFLQVPLADVNSISYDFQIGAGGAASDEEQFYMNVYVTVPPSPTDKFYDCRYNVVPAVGSTSAFTTVTFDPDDSYLVTTRATSPVQPCPASPADLPAGANVRAIALNIGDTSASDVGLDGYLDRVEVDLDSGVTIYNFDPAPPTPNDKDDCKKSGWADLFRDDDTPFKNQGDCIQYVNTGK
jgi:hypothetical protein